MRACVVFSYFSISFALVVPTVGSNYYFLFDLFDNISFFYYSFVFSFVRRVFRCAAISSPSVAVPSREYVFDFAPACLGSAFGGWVALCVFSPTAFA